MDNKLTDAQISAQESQKTSTFVNPETLTLSPAGRDAARRHVDSCFYC